MDEGRRRGGEHFSFQKFTFLTVIEVCDGRGGGRNRGPIGGNGPDRGHKGEESGEREEEPQ